LLIDQKRKEGRREELRVLEIGSWAGQSAILWGTELVRSGYPGKVYCVDPWMPFADESQIGVNNGIQLMDEVARRDKIFPLFWHNVKASGLADVIVPLRCKSADFLPYLKPNSFDLVFVDGSHAYSQFMNDLALAAPLVRQSGFICGDDLELQSDEVDLSTAERDGEKDFITDPRTQREYHPGVCLGVSRFFKRKVSVYDGFWIARKNLDHWTDVQLS
jgi:predicted O-methyltransferase YrrM